MYSNKETEMMVECMGSNFHSKYRVFCHKNDCMKMRILWQIENQQSQEKRHSSCDSYKYLLIVFYFQEIEIGMRQV